MRKRGDNVAWERGWEGHQQEQLRRLASLPLAEKLKWLEETHHVVRHLSGVTLDSAIKSGSMKRKTSSSSTCG